MPKLCSVEDHPIPHPPVPSSGSRGSEGGPCNFLQQLKITWPAHSPDLNPLDFHFWGEAQQEVYREQQESIESLIQCVKRFAETYEASAIERGAENVLKRANMCLEANNRGHLQHLLQ